MARALLLLVATCAATSGSIAVADGPGARVRTAKAQSRRRTERTQRRGPRTSAYLALTANTSRRLVVLDHWKGHGIGQQLMVCTMPCARHSHRFPANPVSSPIVALPALTHHRSPLAPHTRGGAPPMQYCSRFGRALRCGWHSRSTPTELCASRHACRATYRASSTCS